MKRLVCEMCGSTDLVKDGGVFICQACGCKYSLEEAKKMMVEGTVEVAGTVKIDRSDNYNNLVQLARDAFTDGRFDSAYTYSSEALTITPNDPEMVAMQGLAVLGKENIVTDVPSSSVNAMKRMLSIIPDCGASFDGQVEILNTVKGYIDVVAKFKSAGFEESIKALESQKVAYSSASETAAAANLALQALGGNIFTQNSAQSDLEKIQAKRAHNEGLDAQINKIRERARKVTSFQQSYKREIDSGIRKVRQAAAEYLESQKAAYWAAHPEERAVLDNRMAELQAQYKPVDDEMNEAIKQKKDIERMVRDGIVPARAKSNELREKIRQLENTRANLGLFKGKEKKEISEQIRKLERQVPSYEEITKQKEELRANRKPEIDALAAKIEALRVRADSIQSQIDEVQAEIDNAGEAGSAR